LVEQIKRTTTGEKHMRLRTSAISVAIILLAVVSSASSTTHGQSQPEADAISGKWDAVLTIQDNPEMIVKLRLDLKLDGAKVTGTFESSSQLGNGAINGSWVDN
jgi:hypothetical protein